MNQNPIKEATTEKDLKLRPIAEESFQRIYTFLNELGEKKQEIDRIFIKSSKGLYDSIDLSQHVPFDDWHAKLSLSFRPQMGGGAILVKRPDGNFQIVLLVSARFSEKHWNEEFVRNIDRWFGSKRGLYAIEFSKFLKFSGLAVKILGPDAAKKEKQGKLSGKVEHAKQEVRELIEDMDSRVEFAMKFGLTANSFIKTVSEKFIGKEYINQLFITKRFALYKELYEFYVEMKDMMKNKFKKQNDDGLNVEPVVNEVIKRIVENLKQKEWKDVDKLEDKKEFLPKDEPKQSDFHDLEIELRDAFGLGGEEQLETPERKLPPKEKDTDVLQLDGLTEED